MNFLKANEWIRKLYTGGTAPAKRRLILIFLAGVLLLAVTFPDFGGKDENGGDAEGKEEGRGALDSVQEYQDAVEKRTEALLSQVDGAGKVSVMITLKSGNRKVVEKDRTESRQNASDINGDSASGTTEESTSETVSVYSQYEDGSSEPYVSAELYPEVEGVAVICSGGGNPVVQQDLTEAVQALFGVEAHKIKIMKRA